MGNPSLLKSEEYWQSLWTDCNRKSELELIAVTSNVIPIKKVKAVEKLLTISQPIQNTIITNPDYQLILEEQAMMFEYETGITQDYAKVVVGFRNTSQTKVIGKERWLILQKVINYLFQQDYSLLRNFIAYDWSVADIFGCDKNAPDKVFYNMGLVMLMKETDRLDNISNKVILINNSRGGITSYGRPYISTRNNQVLIQQLL
jgi:hypothetical protein